MGYFKTIDDDIIVSINTVDGAKGNIDEKEFLMLKELFNKMPTDKMLNKDLKYVDRPMDDASGKGSLTPDEAWKIIESSNISKENKALLKDYIYKEG